MNVLRAVCLCLALLAAAFSAWPENREVAITIDDLPRGGDLRTSSVQADREMTVKLLSALRHGHVPVTGFVNACNRPNEVTELLLLWVKAGADLGNHTCTHPDLNKTTAMDFEADIIRGEELIARALGGQPMFFRYPFLHTGDQAETKQAVEEFIKERGYRNAPVSLDTSDWVFATAYGKHLTPSDADFAKQIRDAYLEYMEGIFEFFEARSAEVAGHEIRQILLIHANQLNADSMHNLLAMIRGRGYRFVSLAHALRDPAYELPETYVGPGGFSWVHRWSLTKKMKPKGEPEPPDWVSKEAASTP